MKINGNNSMYAGCVFLGGTCANSTWRQTLTPKMKEDIPFFNPQVDDWTPEDAQREDACKPMAKLNVFVITGDSLGTYSGWEIHEEAIRAPEKLVFCAIGNIPKNQQKGIEKIKQGLIKLGAHVCENLDEVAEYINAAF